MKEQTWWALMFTEDDSGELYPLGTMEKPLFPTRKQAKVKRDSLWTPTSFRVVRLVKVEKAKEK